MSRADLARVHYRDENALELLGIAVDWVLWNQGVPRKTIDIAAKRVTELMRPHVRARSERTPEGT